MRATPRVVEAGLRSFICAYDGYVEEPISLGQLVAVREGGVTVLGVVADAASGPEDPSRPLQPRGGAAQSGADVMAGNPEIRLLLRTRLTVVSCGYASGERVFALLPPSPPPLLARVECAAFGETAALAAGGAFLAPLVASPLCDDAVIIASIRSAAPAFAPDAHAFHIAAGKELARLLRAEPARLSTILRGVPQ